MKKYLLIIFTLFSKLILATCSQSQIIVLISPDAYYYEDSWTISDSTGNVITSRDSSRGDTICVRTGSCHLFTIHDSYGDGINSPGYFRIYLDGNLVTSGNNFGFTMQYPIGCTAGRYCDAPLPMTYGTSTAKYEDTWYEFTRGSA